MSVCVCGGDSGHWIVVSGVGGQWAVSVALESVTGHTPLANVVGNVVGNVVVGEPNITFYSAA